MLTIDFANCLSERVGPHGLDGAILADGADAAREAAQLTAALASTRGTGWEIGRAHV